MGMIPPVNHESYLQYTERLVNRTQSSRPVTPVEKTKRIEKISAKLISYKKGREMRSVHDLKGKYFDARI